MDRDPIPGKLTPGKDGELHEQFALFPSPQRTFPEKKADERESNPVSDPNQEDTEEVVVVSDVDTEDKFPPRPEKTGDRHADAEDYQEWLAAVHAVSTKGK